MCVAIDERFGGRKEDHAWTIGLISGRGGNFHALIRVLIWHHRRRREGRGIDFDFPPASGIGQNQSQQGGKGDRILL